MKKIVMFTIEDVNNPTCLPNKKRIFSLHFITKKLSL